MIRDFFVIAMSSMRKRQMRSWLTILGILIGIAAVTSLISVSQGMQSAIEKQFETLGTDIVIVVPGGGEGIMAMTGMGVGQVTDHDVNLIEGISGVEHVVSIVYKTAKVSYNDEVKYTMVMGMPTDPDSLWVLEKFRVEGRYPKEGDNYKAVVGYLLPAGRFFTEEAPIGSKIYIEDRAFQIIGSIQEMGNSQDDSQIYIPIDIAREIFNEPTEIDMLYIKVQPGYETSDVSDRIEEGMRRDRGLKKGEEDFTVQSSEQLMESISSILGIVQMVLIGIAAISLLVGGVGVMNTMYTSVLERTREIGIMKAIGARNSTIMYIFLIESGMLGLVGGAIGCIIGSLISVGVEFFAAQAGYGMLKAAVTPELIFFALSFSFGLGCIAGSLPARSAAKLNPVEALRYE